MMLNTLFYWAYHTYSFYYHSADSDPLPCEGVIVVVIVPVIVSGIIPIVLVIFVVHHIPTE